MKDLAELFVECPVCGNKNKFQVHAADVRILAPTNADRIRAMTDEELAKWMAINTDCFYCKIKNKNICSLDEGTCIEEWRFWLKSPVEVEDG